MDNSTGIPILDLLIQHEEAVRNLYKACVRKFPKQADFWGTLVREEQAHAEVLIALARELKAENVFLNDRKFNTVGVNTAIAHINKQRQLTETSNTPFLQVVAIALDIERAMVEKDFFDIFETDTPAMKQEFTALRKHSAEHAHRIAKMLDQLK